MSKIQHAPSTMLVPQTEQPAAPLVPGYVIEQTEEQPEKPTATNVKTQWVYDAGRNVYFGVPPAINTIPSGTYIPMTASGEAVFRPHVEVEDELIELPGSCLSQVVNDINDFWKNESLFKEYGFTHRRGYLFHGAQGTGKTSLVRQISKNVLKQNGIILLCVTQPHVVQLALSSFRSIEPHRPVMCLFEDLDAIIASFGESTVLNLLDGNLQVDNVLNIATTNFPELLNDRVKNRPRRFEVIHVAAPAEEMRALYFEHKLKIDKAELDKWVQATEDFSFAACAELVISVKCLKKNFEATVAFLKEQSKAKPDSKNYAKKSAGVGFATTACNL